MIYLQLFLTFFKTGLFAVGGGLATLPFLYEISHKYGWFTEAELADMIAVAESTPGPIGVNMATFAGIRTAGIPGGILATFALILPAFLIMLLIATLLKRFQENPYVQSAMRILRPTSIGLIGAAFFSVVKVALLDVSQYAQGGIVSIFRWEEIILCAVLAIVAWRWKKAHPLILVALGAVAGILLKL